MLSQSRQFTTLPRPRHPSQHLFPLKFRAERQINHARRLASFLGNIPDGSETKVDSERISCYESCPDTGHPLRFPETMNYALNSLDASNACGRVWHCS